MKISYESHGNETYLVLKLDDKTNVDTISLGMISNNNIAGLSKATFSQMDGDKFVKYNVSSKVKLAQILQSPIQKNKILNILLQISNALIECEDYMIDPLKIILDPEYIYINVITNETSLICVPDTDYSRTVQDKDFFKNIIYTTRFDNSEPGNYVTFIINYLNGNEEFNILKFRDLISDLMRGGTASTGYNNFNQSPFNGRPPMGAMPMHGHSITPGGVPNVPQNNPVFQGGNVPMQGVNNFQGRPPMPPQGQPPVPTPVVDESKKKDKSKKKKESTDDSGKKKGFGLFKSKKDASADNVNIPGMQDVGFAIPGTIQAPTINNTAPDANQKNECNPANSDNSKGKPSVTSQKTTMIPNNVLASQDNIPRVKVQDNHDNFGETCMLNAQNNNNPQHPQNYNAPPVGIPPQHPMQQHPPVQQRPMQQHPPVQQRPMRQQPPVQQIPVQPPVQQRPIQQPSMQQVPPQQRATQFVQTVPPIRTTQPYVVPSSAGETTLLNADTGETTILSVNQQQPARKMAYITRVKNNVKVPINKPVFRIGKEKSYVDLFVGDNTAVSRSHANIIERNGQYYIVDTNSTNHTFINNQMIQSNKEVLITDNCRIRLANEDFVFTVE